MTKVEARRRIWERMAATARADVDLGEWIYDELEHARQPYTDANVKRLEDACHDVAEIIERVHLRGRRTRR